MIAHRGRARIRGRCHWPPDRRTAPPPPPARRPAPGDRDAGRNGVPPQIVDSTRPSSHARPDAAEVARPPVDIVLPGSPYVRYCHEWNIPRRCWPRPKNPAVNSPQRQRPGAGTAIQHDIARAALLATRTAARRVQPVLPTTTSRGYSSRCRCHHSTNPTASCGISFQQHTSLRCAYHLNVCCILGVMKDSSAGVFSAIHRQACRQSSYVRCVRAGSLSQARQHLDVPPAAVNRVPFVVRPGKVPAGDQRGDDQRRRPHAGRRARRATSQPTTASAVPAAIIASLRRYQ